MQLMKRQKNGVAACDINVESWTELPVLYVKRERLEEIRASAPGSYEDSAKRPVLAAAHFGRCLRCAKDIQKQMHLLSYHADFSLVRPKFSYRNNMDPCWKFPLQELGDLFRSLTLVESMLISLEHMQVHFVTVHKTRLHKFRKNLISFPQESAKFFGRKGALRQYRVGERVNSSRGPLLEGEDDERPPKLKEKATADQ